MRTDYRKLAVGLVLAALMAGAPPAAVGQETATAISSTASISLTARGVAGASGERQFEARLQDKTSGEWVSGPLRLKGVSSFTGGAIGDIDYQVSGSRVTGKITKSGREIATFEGTIGATSISGTFTSTGGTVGEWYWDGTSPTTATP